MIKIKNVTFIKSYTEPKRMPQKPIPEIAFIGRSNVGKSSLLNHLTNRKIAKCSSTPGKTRLINLFSINNDEVFFVDLPGYGYAKVSGKVKQSWPKFIDSYLQEREQLRAICFLLDIRRMPNAHDIQLNNWLKTLKDITVFYVLTKVDKLSTSQRSKNKLKIAMELMVDISDFFLYSTTKNIGRTELMRKIDPIIFQE